MDSIHQWTGIGLMTRMSRNGVNKIKRSTDEAWIMYGITYTRHYWDGGIMAWPDSRAVYFVYSLAIRVIASLHFRWNDSSVRRTLRRSLHLARNGSDLLNDPSYPCLVSLKVRIKKVLHRLVEPIFKSRDRGGKIFCSFRYVRMYSGSRISTDGVFLRMLSDSIWLSGEDWTRRDQTLCLKLSQTLSEQWPHLIMELARCCHLDAQHFVFFLTLIQPGNVRVENSGIEGIAPMIAKGPDSYMHSVCICRTGNPWDSVRVRQSLI